MKQARRYSVYAHYLGDRPVFIEIGCGSGERTLCHAKHLWPPNYQKTVAKWLHDGYKLKVRCLLDNLTAKEAKEIWGPFFVRALGRRQQPGHTGPLYNDSWNSPARKRAAKRPKRRKHKCWTRHRIDAYWTRTRRRAYGEASRQKWKDPAYRAKMLAINARPEVKAKKSAARKAVWDDPWTRHWNKTSRDQQLTPNKRELHGRRIKAGKARAKATREALAAGKPDPNKLTPEQTKQFSGPMLTRAEIARDRKESLRLLKIRQLIMLKQQIAKTLLAGAVEFLPPANAKVNNAMAEATRKALAAGEPDPNRLTAKQVEQLSGPGNQHPATSKEGEDNAAHL